MSSLKYTNANRLLTLMLVLVLSGVGCSRDDDDVDVDIPEVDTDIGISDPSIDVPDIDIKDINWPEYVMKVPVMKTFETNGFSGRMIIRAPKTDDKGSITFSILAPNLDFELELTDTVTGQTYSHDGFDAQGHALEISGDVLNKDGSSTESVFLIDVQTKKEGISTGSLFAELDDQSKALAVNVLIVPGKYNLDETQSLDFSIPLQIEVEK